MMNKKMISFIFIMMLTVNLLFASTVFASSKNVDNLIIKIDQTSKNDINNAMKELYQDQVIPRIIPNCADLIYSNVSDQAIKDATLSTPIPILASKDKYKKGEDYKSKLEFSEWMFIAYANGKPIVIFSVDKQNGQYIVSNVFNENFAKSFVDAANKLNGKNYVVFPNGGYYFIGDTNDNIALVEPQNTSEDKNDVTTRSEQNNAADGRYGVKTFDELNSATNKAIDYYSDQSDIPLGGSIVLDYLYGANITNGKSSATYITIIAVGIICLGASSFFFRAWRNKVKPY